MLGGWMVEHFSWRSVFVLNLPLAAVVVGITLWRVNESKNEKLDAALDWPGALFASIGLGGITYALIEASEKASGVLVAASVGVIALIAFLIREARCPAPMVPLALFKSRTFAGANLITFFLYSGLGGILYFLPFTLIQIHHYSAAEVPPADICLPSVQGMTGASSCSSKTRAFSQYSVDRPSGRPSASHRWYACKRSFSSKDLLCIPLTISRIRAFMLQERRAACERAEGALSARVDLAIHQGTARG